MTLLEKFNERKKAMYAKFDEAREACEAAIDAAGHEFLEDFKSLVVSASEEEFYELICKNNGELDEIEILAAMTARLEGRKDAEEQEEAKPKKGDGPGIFIIGLG